MPSGTITSFDADAGQGVITTDDGDEYTFGLDDLVDRSSGETPQTDAEVTFEADGDRATQVHRVAHRGYE